MTTPIIETERLILRPLVLEDAEDIYERWTSDDRISRYVRWYTHKSPGETRAWIEAETANLGSDKSYQWGFTLKDTGYLFGSGGLVYNEAEQAFELGYNIMYSFWRQGYTTEAANAMLDFAVETLGQRDFIAWHAVDNPASGSVLKKCGFVYEKDEKRAKFDGVTDWDARFYRCRL